MKKHYSSLLALLLVLALVFSLTACNFSGGGAAVCQHRDQNDDSLCDKCDVPYTDGKDIPDAPVCQHRDADDDAKCDECEEVYADGIDIPHTHSGGTWTQYGNGENLTCEEQLLYRICDGCGEIEWKNGEYDNHNFQTVTHAPTCTAQGYDEKTCTVCGFVDKVNYTDVKEHDYKTAYTANASFHWLECQNCDATKGYGEHTAGDNGACTVCEEPLAPTEGIVYDISADGTYAEVIGYTGKATKILIADTYKGLPVKTIYKQAFCDNHSIVSVVIPDSVTTIGENAFAWCNSLTSVVIGNNVTSIGYCAFEDCYNLTSVVIPDSVTVIAERAFDGCRNLTSVYITDIAAWCGISFYYSSMYGTSNPLSCGSITLYLNGESITELIIPDGVTSVPDYAFEGQSSITSVVIPDSVTVIDKSAFYGCRNLTSVVIEGSPLIGSYAFYDCHSSLYTEYEFGKYVKVNENPYAILQEVTNQNLSAYKIHENTRFIGSSAFYFCERFASIAIPDSVESIGGYAFEYCKSLTSVAIPDSVTYIGDEAFAYCNSLTSVVIGDSVTSIGYEAFGGWNNLTSVTFENHEGWRVSKDANATSGTEISAEDLANTSTAAYYLRSTYRGYYWFCG